MMGPIGGAGSTVGFGTTDDYKSVASLDLVSRAYETVDSWRDRGGDEKTAKKVDEAVQAYLDAWRSLEQIRAWAYIVRDAVVDAPQFELISRVQEALRACGVQPTMPDYYLLAPVDLLRDAPALNEHLTTLGEQGDSVRQTLLKLATGNLEGAVQAVSGDPQAATTAAKSDARLAGEAVPKLPFRYRMAFPNSPRRCANCEFFKAGTCNYYQENVSPDYVCDSWQQGEAYPVADEDNEHARAQTGDWQPNDKAYSRQYKSYVRVESRVKADDQACYQVTLLTPRGQAKGTALVPASDLKSARAAKEWQMGVDFDRLNSESRPLDEVRAEVERVVSEFDRIAQADKATDSELLNPLRELLAFSLGGPIWVKVDTGERRRYYRAMQTALSAIGAARQLLFTAYRHQHETGSTDFKNTYEQIRGRVQAARQTLVDSLTLPSPTE